ncbi:hypothetical protein CBS147320_9042 [Aspergillus niger]|nr:hypothetical protein CBS147320_9042 [Aspergillus niger]
MAFDNSHNDKDCLEPIAIVGLSLRFPAGATDLDRFFNLITEARCVSQAFPSDRLDVTGAYWPKAAAAVPTVSGGHFLAEDITAFDAPFFGISAVEAASMDPQQRLLLETSYVALENAGIPIEQITGSNASVYVGCFTDDYKELYRKDVRDSAPYAATGITTTLNANRVSWFYNFMGPSINVDTACSSSLVALDLACQALRAGQTDMCLAGGANLILAPDLFHILSEMSMLSPDSRSYSFDARGNGYGRGEGVAMLVLKRMSCALRDGDTIRAVVRSTACNQNGYTPGITQPSMSAQEALINECYARAGLDKARTGYVEAHGTGTPAGDPIEAEALGASFRDSRRPGERLYVGSVKANIGHLEGSSGIAGVIKAVAMLERGWIPAIADLQSVNSMIDEAALRLQVGEHYPWIPWPRPGLRRISVNSFGFGGSNAHAVLDDAYHFLLEHQLDGVAYRPRTDSSTPQEEIIPVYVLRDQRSNSEPPLLPPSSSVAPTAAAGVQQKRVRLLPLSSSDKAGITRTVTSLTEYFQSRGGGTAEAATPPSVEFSDALAYTLAQRRSFLPWRACAVVPSDKPLHEFRTMVSPAVKSPKTPPKIAFVFTGQGAQWAQMGADLCVYSVFRRRLEEADEDLRAFGCDWRLLDELAKPAETSRINEPRISQVLCTVVQIALVDLLNTFGIMCSVVIGHSSGEIAAAYCCGAISARSAWRIAFLRGTLVSATLQESTVSGAMLAVGLSAADAASYLDGSDAGEDKMGSRQVSIACFNSPNNVTLSGDEAAIDALKAKFDAAGIFARKLSTGVAYHSNHLHSVADAYASAIGEIEAGEHGREQGLLQRTDASVVMVSTVSGQRVPAEMLRQGSYWASNLVRPVRFLQAFQSLLSKRGVVKKLDGSHRLLMDINTCVEIGPHGALRGPIKEILQAQDHPMTYLATLQRAQPGADALLRSVGHLWCLGLSINWKRVNHEPHTSETDLDEREEAAVVPPALVSLADLPPYAWEHSRRFFHESRTSRNHRLRSKPRSKLLGEAAVDWNALEARWGNFLKRSEHPWIEDHQINGTILFPAAGMMAMAVEAMQQQVQLAGAASINRPILGYELRDIHLSTALVIPDHERGVEVQFILRRQQQQQPGAGAGGGSRDGGWWSDFRLCAYLEGEWEEICTGSIRVDFGVAESGIGTQRVAQARLRSLQDRHASLQQQQQQHRWEERGEHHGLEIAAFYERLAQHGLEFGPAFRTLVEAQWAGGRDCRAVVKVHHPQDDDEVKYVVHPCTLDALLHMPMVALTQDPVRRRSTAIPSNIRRVWIASSGLGWSSSPLSSELQTGLENTLDALAEIVATDRRGCEVQSHALSHDRARLLAELEGVRLTIVNDMADQMTDDDHGVQDCTWNLVWKPDLDLMTGPQVAQWCSSSSMPSSHEGLDPTSGDPADFYRDLAFLHYSMLSQTTSSGVNPSKPHLQKYMDWARRQVRRVEAGETPHWELSWPTLAKDLNYRNALMDRLEQVNAQGRVHVAVARHLDQLVVGQMDPLELLFGSSLLDSLYAELSGSDTLAFTQLGEYLQLYSHKYPNSRYLEIGAGTGGTTAAILHSLGEKQGQLEVTGPRYQEYTYSDISEAYFDAAKTRFERYPGLLFRRLDIEEDLLSQGYTPESYDVVVGANVLHATKDLRATLQKARALLRPGGKLILFEITAPALGRSGFIMGLLPGWWLSSEGYRSEGPCVPLSTWDALLQETGFTGVEQEFRDYRSDACHELSVLVSSRQAPSDGAGMLLQELDTPGPAAPAVVNIVPHPTHSPQGEGQSVPYATAIQKYLQHIGAPSQITPMDQVEPGTRLTIVTVDLDLDRPFLRSMNPEDFAALQRMIRHSHNVAWVSRTVDDGSSDPAYNMVTGLARVCLAEEEGHRFLRVGLTGPPMNNTPSEAQLKALLLAVQQMLRPAADPSSSEAYEMEYEQRAAEGKDLFHIARLQQDRYCQEGVHRTLHPLISEDRPWQEAPMPLKLTTQTPGLLESLRFVADQEHDAVPLAVDEVEIQVHAVGLNFKDCLIALGRVPADTLGNECAGVVTRVGPACSPDKVRVGDRVCMSTVEAFKTYARSKVQCVCRLPEAMSFTTAAAIPTQFVTAWTSLVQIGRLTQGEKVLIHAGAGGTGQAAIQISQYLGADVYVTVSSEAKRDLLMDTYAIPEGHIFYSRDVAFAQGVKDATGGRGVDLVLNSLSGECLLASWDCLAPYGRFVEIGKKDILDNARLPMLPFNRGVSFSAFDGSTWMLERPEQAERGIHTIMALFEQGVLQPAHPLRVRSVTEVQQAFAALADGKTSGKTVIEITPTASVPMTLPAAMPTQGFLGDATYVLAGGFGGIGRSIARWMAERGARHLLILSRSGPQSPEARQLVADLHGAGVRVHAPVCNLADRETLSRVLHEAQSPTGAAMPPIRGCIQASMVLQDTLLAEMTHAQWVAAVQPKVAGSWNLHACLEHQPLDFFVCLSSVSGVAGQRGQSNYAAGNTFQDSLARYRVARGLPAVSLDLGAMVDDGFLTQNQTIRDRLLGGGSMVPITRPKFLALLEFYCCRAMEDASDKDEEDLVVVAVAPADAPPLTLANCQTVFGINTPQAMQVRGLDEPGWMQRPLFGLLHRVSAASHQHLDSKSGPGRRPARDFRAELGQAASLEEATQIVAQALIAKIVRSLSGLADEDVEASQPIVSCGVDSLLAVEIRSWFAKIFQADVSTFAILGGMSFERVGRLVAIRSMLKKGWV